MLRTIPSPARLVTLVVGTAIALTAAIGAVPLAQAQQNDPALQQLRAETNMLCAKARELQQAGKDAYQRSQDTRLSAESRAAAQQEVGALKPMYDRYKELCLQKKKEYSLAASTTPSPDTQGIPAGMKVKYVDGRYICSQGYACPYKSLCMLGECSPGVERNRFWVCGGYGCKVNGDSCSCAATFKGKPCCTRLAYP